EIDDSKIHLSITLINHLDSSLSLMFFQTTDFPALSLICLHISCLFQPREPADDWSEHISSSGKKYYYNCRTEVSQWEKPKEWLEREQRQREGAKTVVNSFPKDRDYRQEAMQASATSALSSTKSTLAEKPLSNSGYSQPLSINPSSTSSSSSSSTVPVSPALQASASTLLQDPALLRQLLPALQATLQMNHGNVDMGKINEGINEGMATQCFSQGFERLLGVDSVVGSCKKMLYI
uniref:WW domain containing adaptor with coiled-coil b n=1 Tax=Sinocyclocheilus grahami TaxID=75366 RepID=A0A672K5X7_SINGR